MFSEVIGSYLWDIENIYIYICKVHIRREEKKMRRAKMELKHFCKVDFTKLNKI